MGFADVVRHSLSAAQAHLYMTQRTLSATGTTRMSSIDDEVIADIKLRCPVPSLWSKLMHLHGSQISEIKPSSTVFLITFSSFMASLLLTRRNLKNSCPVYAKSFRKWVYSSQFRIYIRDGTLKHRLVKSKRITELHCHSPSKHDSQLHLHWVLKQTAR